VQNPPTVGLKWKAADDSSPMAVVVSKYSPEVAAKNANRTTALDRGEQSALMDLNDAIHCPTLAQKFKQVGGNPNASSSMAMSEQGSSSTSFKTTAPVLSERQEMMWHEERPDGTFVQHTREQTTSVDGRGRMAVMQQANVSSVHTPTPLEMMMTQMAEFQMTQFKNLEAFQMREFKTVERNFMLVENNFNRLDVTLQNQGVKMSDVQQQCRDLGVGMHNRKRDISHLEANVRKLEAQHILERNQMQRQLDEAKGQNVALKGNLKKQRDQSDLRFNKQVQADKDFDTAHAKNHELFKTCINGHSSELEKVWKELDALKKARKIALSSENGSSSSDCRSLGEGSRRPSKPYKGKGKEVQDNTEMFTNDASVDAVVEGLMQLHNSCMHQEHLEVNGNPTRSCRQKKRAVVMDAGTSRHVSKKPKVPDASEASGNVAQICILDLERAKDERQGLLFRHASECINVVKSKGSNIYMFQTMVGGATFKDQQTCMASAMQIRREFCVKNPTSPLAKRAGENFKVSEKAKAKKTSISVRKYRPKMIGPSVASSSTASSMRRRHELADQQWEAGLNSATESDSYVSDAAGEGGSGYRP
jgi:hypothetical protein